MIHIASSDIYLYIGAAFINYTDRRKTPIVSDANRHSSVEECRFLLLVYTSAILRRDSTGQICCNFLSFEKKIQGVAGALPGEQQSTGLLHLILQIWPSLIFPNKKRLVETSRFLFGGTGQI